MQINDVIFTFYSVLNLLMFKCQLVGVGLSLIVEMFEVSLFGSNIFKLLFIVGKTSSVLP